MAARGIVPLSLRVSLLARIRRILSANADLGEEDPGALLLRVVRAILVQVPHEVGVLLSEGPEGLEPLQNAVLCQGLLVLAVLPVRDPALDLDELWDELRPRAGDVLGADTDACAASINGRRRIAAHHEDLVSEVVDALLSRGEAIRVGLLDLVHPH
eukprot:4648572-Alexandrium_andersonii.AAC.1